MVGAIDADAVMHDKPQGRGYIKIQRTEDNPWPHLSDAVISGHEFHYSTLENFNTDYPYAYKVVRGAGINGQSDGIIYKNMLACYAHLRDTQQHHWAASFVEFVRLHKSNKPAVTAVR
jgi:cobyrinic acid a,c-diamide synthase